MDASSQDATCGSINAAQASDPPPAALSAPLGDDPPREDPFPEANPSDVPGDDVPGNDAPSPSQPQPALVGEPGATPNAPTTSGMQDYYQLNRELFTILFILIGVVFSLVWIVNSLPTALNYLLGALLGAVYLRMLAREVERMGQKQSALGKGRLALIILPIVLATRLDRLEILPIFLGFLTYKPAFVLSVLRDQLRDRQ